jgi:hypothetical protein
MNEQVQLPDNSLMSPVWSRRHQQFPVNQLVARREPVALVHETLDFVKSPTMFPNGRHGHNLIASAKLMQASMLDRSNRDCSSSTAIMPTGTMHPRIEELLDYIEKQMANLRAAYEAVPIDRRAVRVVPDRWSPAEIIHHLAIVERRLAQRLAALIEQARALPPETETTSALTRQSTTTVLDRTARLVTSEPLEPRDTDPASAWDDYVDAHQEVVRVIRTGDGLALGAVSAPHPALGPFTGYEWMAFIGSHAARHADQIREMKLAR